MLFLLVCYHRVLMILIFVVLCNIVVLVLSNDGEIVKNIGGGSSLASFHVFVYKTNKMLRCCIHSC